MHARVKNTKSPSGNKKTNENKTVLKIISERKKAKSTINETDIRGNSVEHHLSKGKKKGKKKHERSATTSEDVSLLMPKLDLKPEPIIDKPPKKPKLGGNQSEVTENLSSNDPNSEDISKKEVQPKKKRKKEIDVDNTENNEILNPELDLDEENTGTAGAQATSKDSGKKSKNKNKEPKNEETNEQVTKPKNFVLFLGNIPYDITETEVREHFKAVKGSIKRITLLTNPKTGEGRGCGFLELTTAKAYHDALKLNLSQLQDRKINVEFTVPGKKGSKRRNKYIKVKTKKLLGQWKKGKKVIK